MSLALLVAAVLVLGEPASSEPPLTAQDVKVRPKAGLEATPFYPDAAQKKEIEGEASVACLITPGGGMTDCQVVAETPAGQGFGAAAAKVAKGLLVSKKAYDGRATAGRRFRFDMAFRLPKV